MGQGLRRARLGERSGAQKLRQQACSPAGHAAARTGPHRTEKLWIAALLVAGGTVAGVFQSCSGARSRSAQREPALTDQPASREEAAISEKANRKATLDQAATDLQALFDKLGQDERAATDTTDTGHMGTSAATGVSTPADQPIAEPAAHRGPTDTPARSYPPAAQPSEPSVRLERSGVPFSGGANVAAALDERVPDSGELAREFRSGQSEAAGSTVRRAELAAELVEVLAARRGRSDSDALRTLAPLLALEAVQPGAAAFEIDAAMKNLTPDEAATASTLRALLRRVGSDADLAADPRALARELRDRLDQLEAETGTGGLALGTVALCTRVESFGRYTPLGSSRLLAGRVNAAIVYAEITDFVQRGTGADAGVHVAGDPDGYVVQLEQRIELWHDDGSLQWRAPAASVRDTSRTRRNDFFLVQRIDLPANLSVGKYNLKVTVRDTGASGDPTVETVIPVEIVADAAVAREGTRPARTPDDVEPRSRSAPDRTGRSTRPDPRPVAPVVKRGTSR